MNEVSAVIDSDAVKPCAQGGAASEILQAAMNLEKDFLDDVFQLGARTDHAKHEARHFGAMAKEELPKSIAVPPLAARDHFVWFEHSIEANASAGPVP